MSKTKRVRNALLFYLVIISQFSIKRNCYISENVSVSQTSTLQVKYLAVNEIFGLLASSCIDYNFNNPEAYTVAPT